jgi:hypothetical protein
MRNYPVKCVKWVWLVKQARFYDDFTHIESAHYTKASAEAHCRADGYRFDSDEGFFKNEADQQYRKIWKQPILATP